MLKKESLLRNFIKNLILENDDDIFSNVSDLNIGGWDIVWEDFNWSLYDESYDDEWYEVQDMLDEWLYLNVDDYADEYDYDRDYETLRDRFEDAAERWFNKNSERKEMLRDFSRSQSDISYPERDDMKSSRDFSSSSNKKYKSRLGGAWS